MANEVKPPGSKSDDMVGYAFLVCAGIAALVFFLVPAIIGAVAYYFSRNYLSRREYALLAVAGAVASFLTFTANIGDYSSWVWSLLTLKPDFSTTPIVFVISFACFLTGVAGYLLNTSISGKLPRHLRRRNKKEEGAILPTSEAKARVASIVSAPGSVLADSPSLVNEADPKNRAFPIGADTKGSPVLLYESQIKTHGMILGATGSGKTEAIKVMAGGLLDLGWSGMVLDLKEDAAAGGLRDWCETYSAHHSRPYQELRLSDPNSQTWFNPLAGMGPDEIRDTILALQEFDDAYWMNLNKELLGQLVNLLVWANQADPTTFPAPSMYDLGKLLAQGDLKGSTKKHRAFVQSAIPGVTSEDFRSLENPSQDMQKSATGFGSKLTQFYDTQAGRTVLRPGSLNERRLIDVTQEGLTYIGLDSQGKADLTKIISSAVLQRMSVYAAQRVTSSEITEPLRPRFLIVDEANWVNRTIVQSLLSRARSAGIAMVLCTQGPKDWIDKQGDDWGKLTQNVNVALVMGQGEAESAKLCADHIGMIYKKQQSEMVRESRGLLFNKAARNAEGEIMESYSIREELAYLVEPDDLRRMGVGEAILKVRSPEEQVTWVKLPMRDPKLIVNR